MEVVLKFDGRIGTLKVNWECFNPCFDGSGSEIHISRIVQAYSDSFNPCFDGSGSEILTATITGTLSFGFNPCFDGSGSEII